MRTCGCVEFAVIFSLCEQLIACAIVNNNFRYAGMVDASCEDKREPKAIEF